MKVILTALCLLLGASGVEATTYYVRTDGNNANAGTTNSSGGAWRTIAKGLSTATTAGDFIRIQAGTYNETNTAGASGTSGNTITVVADGTVTSCSLAIASRSYLRVIGLTLDTSACSRAPALTITGTNTGLELWNITANNNKDNVVGHQNATDRCDKCIIIGLTVNGNYTNPDTVSGTGLNIFGDDNVVAYYRATDLVYVGLGPGGTRNRYLNVNCDALVQSSTTHPDCFFVFEGTFGFSFNLFESGFDIGTPTSSDNKWHHQEQNTAVAWADNVYRLNVSRNSGSAVRSIYTDSGSASNLRTHIYNDTHASAVRASSSAVHCETLQANGGGGSISASITNNLYYECWGTSISSGVAVFGGNSSALWTVDYNLGYDPDGSVSFASVWTNQVHEVSNSDPKLHDVANNDLHLDASSGAIGLGGPLTTATSCSGTTLNVAANTARFFIPDNSANLTQYSGKLAPGDPITIGTSTVRTVSSISGDAITVDSSLTCSNGDAVYFGSSSTVDIGAYPRKAGGYTLSATYTIAGGTATFTLNDPSLVRFVVCYDSSVPTAVVNAAPFTCSTGSGTFSAKVYPRYASQTLSVDATFNSSTPGVKGKGKMQMRGKDSAAPSPRKGEHRAGRQQAQTRRLGRWSRAWEWDRLEDDIVRDRVANLPTVQRKQERTPAGEPRAPVLSKRARRWRIQTGHEPHRQASAATQVANRHDVGARSDEPVSRRVHQDDVATEREIVIPHYERIDGQVRRRKDFSWRPVRVLRQRQIQSGCQARVISSRHEQRQRSEDAIVIARGLERLSNNRADHTVVARVKRHCADPEPAVTFQQRRVAVRVDDAGRSGRNGGQRQQQQQRGGSHQHTFFAEWRRGVGAYWIGIAEVKFSA